MATNQIPIPNTWYTNRTGKLIKVRLVTLSTAGTESVVIEYLDHSLQLVPIEAWRYLDLTIHSLPALPAPARAPDTV